MIDHSWTDDALKVDSVQVNARLRRAQQGYVHFCPGCGEAHMLFDSWTFDGNLESPTFSPSFKHTMRMGDSERVCHYILTAGILNYCDDSTHTLRGAVPLPDLPEWLRDEP